MFKYDTNEVMADVDRLLEKMTGRKCPSMLSLLAYVDDRDEGGCKILLRLMADNPENIGRMLAASAINVRNVIEKIGGDIRAQLGDEAAEAFSRAVYDEANSNLDSKSATLKQMTQLMTGETR